MNRLACLLGAIALAGCAAAPQAPPGTVVADAKIMPAVQPGVTTKAALLAQFGATTSIRFDNGVEVWRYLTPAAAPGTYGEYVIVIDPRGVVAKARHAAAVYQQPPSK
jgi:hypothetical protein